MLGTGPVASQMQPKWKILVDQLMALWLINVSAESKFSAQKTQIDRQRYTYT